MEKLDKAIWFMLLVTLNVTCVFSLLYMFADVDLKSHMVSFLSAGLWFVIDLTTFVFIVIAFIWSSVRILKMLTSIK